MAGYFEWEVKIYRSAFVYINFKPGLFPILPGRPTKRPGSCEPGLSETQPLHIIPNLSRVSLILGERRHKCRIRLISKFCRFIAIMARVPEHALVETGHR